MHQHPTLYSKKHEIASLAVAGLHFHTLPTPPQSLKRNAEHTPAPAPEPAYAHTDLSPHAAPTEYIVQRELAQQQRATPGAGDTARSRTTKSAGGGTSVRADMGAIAIPGDARAAVGAGANARAQECVCMRRRQR